MLTTRPPKPSEATVGPDSSTFYLLTPFKPKFIQILSHFLGDYLNSFKCKFVQVMNARVFP